MILIPAGEIRDPTLARFDAEVPEWAAGYVDPARRLGAIRVALSAQYPYGTLESVLAHEATHQMLNDAVGDRIPLWFNEGVATMQGRRWSFDDYRIVTTTLLTSDLAQLSALDSMFHASEPEAEVAYAASFSFVSWSARAYGPAFLRDVLHATRDRRFEQAWRQRAGVPLEESERLWRRASTFHYRWIPILTASSTLWLLITLLFVVAGVRKRARAREIERRWAEEERREAELPPDPEPPDLEPPA
jgi:hypothetical protein